MCMKTAKKPGNAARLALKEMQDIAKRRGGKCLSKRYVNSQTKLRWQCKKGHIWEAIPNSVKRGRWCRSCSGYSKLSIIEMQKIAKSRGGKCLSKEYIDNQTRLKWQCKEGHIWEAIPASIKRGAWCSECSDGISERICRKLLEATFSKKFPKTKPAWLVNPKGNKMELDGFCKELGLAFEYQGIQHYNLNYRSYSKGILERRKKDDKLKRGLCKKQGVVLIEVPYYIEYEQMGKYLLKRCKQQGIAIPKGTAEIDYQLLSVYSPEKMKEMREMAERKGGKCLSKNYINNRTKLKWQCKEGHVWGAEPYSVKAGKWCQRCAGLAKKTIGDMQKMARLRGGKCLSKRYFGNRVKLKWQCKEGHVWKAAPYSVKQGFWCRACADAKSGDSQRLNIADMQKIAKQRGGKCLSKVYKNNRTKLKWQCREGHIWETIPANVRRGSWCSKCARTRRPSPHPRA